MYSPLVSWSRLVFLAGLVLAVVFIAPVAWFPFQLGKVAIFATLLAVTIILFIAGRGTSDLLRTHGWRLALLVGLLPMAYLLSAYLSSNQSVSLVGIGIEIDTVLFTTLLFLAFLLSFTFFKTLRTVRLLTSVVFFTLLAAVVLQWLIVIFGGGFLPFDIFTDRSSNLIGKWNDLGIATALLGIFFIIQAELSRASRVSKIASIVGVGASILLLGIINFSLAWWFILVASIVVGLIKFMSQKAEDVPADPYVSSSWMGKMPWISIVTAIIAIIFFFFGTQLNTRLTAMFPVSSLEVRPSYSSSMNIITAARGDSLKNTLLGTGPNTFSTSWLMHKPAEVNQSQFWNLDFNVGFSTLLTALGTVGFLGLIAWFIPFALVLVGLIRAMRLSVLSREERVAAAMIGIGSLALLSTLIFYVPSPNMIILAFVLAGAAFGFLWRQGRESTGGEAPVAMPPIARLAGMGILAALLLLSLWSVWTTDRRFFAQATTNMGIAALQAGNSDDAKNRALSAQRIEKTNDNVRLVVESGILKMQQLANTENPGADIQEQFRKVTEDTVAAGRDLVAMSPEDYRSHLALGRVYDILAALKVQGAYDSARTSYETAFTHNPNSPEIALMLARLAATEGNAEATRTYLSKALTLKPNYTDAILLVVQLSVATNDIPGAIAAAQAAAQTAPGVGPIWFQLGLLYYASNDTKSALQPLENAIQLVPDYANAKYFLGLSYYTQGRSEEAIRLFEDLNRSNPDSAEAKLILANMQAGKPAFEAAQPPVTSRPESRPTAPISE